MSNLPRPSATDRSDEVAAPVDKLVPEWRVSGDDQIVLAGIAAFLLLLGGLGVSRWISGDDAPEEVAVEETSNGGSGDVEGAMVLDDEADADEEPEVEEEAEPEVEEIAEVEEEPEVEEAEPEPEPEAVDLTPDVAATVGSYARVTGVADGSTAVLTGFVDTETDSVDAEAAAADVDGITAVDNQLVVVTPGVESTVVAYPGAEAANADGAVTLTGFVDDDAESTAIETAAGEVSGVVSVDNQLVALEPDVTAALEGADVSNASAEVMVLSATVRGEIADESARQPALDAAAAVPGVVSVVDELTVAGPSVSDQLNELVELEPVQFATSSADVLEASFPTLDRAAEIILGSDVDGVIEIQGYTDVRGDEAVNLELSEARAAAVLEYLVGAGVSADMLASQGFGETTQFGDGDSAEAYAANRRVVFVPVS